MAVHVPGPTSAGGAFPLIETRNQIDRSSRFTCRIAPVVGDHREPEPENEVLADPERTETGAHSTRAVEPHCPTPAMRKQIAQRHQASTDRKFSQRAYRGQPLVRERLYHHYTEPFTIPNMQTSAAGPLR